MGDNTFTTNEKVEYALKTALLLTTSNPYMPSNQELLAPPRVFPSNINSKDLITVGEGDIGADGNYVSGHSNEGELADINKPWNGAAYEPKQLTHTWLLQTQPGGTPG